jgi:hypothetical protein
VIRRVRRSGIDESAIAFLAPFERALRAIAFGAVADPVREFLVPLGARSLPKVVCDARGDRFARDLLASRTGKENEGQVRMFLANRPEELRSVRFGHVVLAHDTVEPPVGHESIQPVAGVRFRFDRESLPFETGPVDSAIAGSSSTHSARTGRPSVM